MQVMFKVLFFSEHQNSSKADDIYYGSTLHSESTIQRPIPRSTDYMKGVISNKWMKGTSKNSFLINLYFDNKD